MIEIIVIISNGIVVVAIGALYAKINSQGKDLTKHVVYTVKEITSRPDFDHMNEKIEKSEQRFCSKLKPIKEDVREVKTKLFEHLLDAK